jgi:hypothetical protein
MRTKLGRIDRKEIGDGKTPAPVWSHASRLPWKPGRSAEVLSTAISRSASRRAHKGMQAPHLRDELYFVASGTAAIAAMRW